MPRTHWLCWNCISSSRRAWTAVFHCTSSIFTSPITSTFHPKFWHVNVLRYKSTQNKTIYSPDATSQNLSALPQYISSWHQSNNFRKSCMANYAQRYNTLDKNLCKLPKSKNSKTYSFALAKIWFAQWEIPSNPPSRRSTYCLTIIDRITCWAEAIPITDITAATVATAFYTNWISRFGTPNKIITYQGRQFESSFLSNLMGIKKVRLLPTTWNQTVKLNVGTAYSKLQSKRMVPNNGPKFYLQFYSVFVVLSDPMLKPHPQKWYRPPAFAYQEIFSKILPKVRTQTHLSNNSKKKMPY